MLRSVRTDLVLIRVEHIRASLPGRLHHLKEGVRLEKVIVIQKAYIDAARCRNRPVCIFCYAVIISKRHIPDSAILLLSLRSDRPDGPFSIPRIIRSPRICNHKFPVLITLRLDRIDQFLKKSCRRVKGRDKD